MPTTQQYRDINTVDQALHVIAERDREIADLKRRLNQQLIATYAQRIAMSSVMSKLDVLDGKLMTIQLIGQ